MPEKSLESSVGIFLFKQCLLFCLEASEGATPKDTNEAKKTRHAKKTAGKVMREEGFRQACSGWERRERGRAL